MFCFCCARILLASAYYKNLDSRARLFKNVPGTQKFPNNQYIQHPLKRSLKPPESISAFRSMVRNTKRVFTVLRKLYKHWVTRGHDRLRAVSPFLYSPSNKTRENAHARDWRRETGNARKKRVSLSSSRATALVSRISRPCYSMLDALSSVWFTKEKRETARSWYM